MFYLLKAKPYVFSFTILILLCPVLTGCGSSEPIKIGFAGELTGARADLGVAGRDGVILAIDQINEQGGINGRSIELIVKDDQGDPDIARQVDAELVDEGVVAIIGHMTSGQVAAVLDQINRDKVVLFGATVSSDRFTGKTDYFFRVSATHMGAVLADHMYHNRGIRQVTGIYDLDNQAFTESFWQAVQARFIESGGDASQSFTFASGETDLQALMTKVKAVEPEAVVFASSAFDTALMAQYGRQLELDAQYFTSGWAHSDELLSKGGRTVEGMEMIINYNAQTSFPAFQEFVQQFETRYKREPTFPAANGYEVVLVLAEALAQTGGQAEGLPQAIIAVENLEGVQGMISMDEYGDVNRDVYIAVVTDDEFEFIDMPSPAD